MEDPKAEDKALEIEEPIQEIVEDDPYSMTPEQLDAIIHDGELKDEPVEEEEAPVEDKLIPETDNLDKTPKETPIPPADEVLLTQELIDKMKLTEDQVKIINSKGLIGKPMSEFVNQYINAQKLIGKKAEDVKRDLFPQSEQDIITPKTPVVFPKDQKAEDADNLMNEIVLGKITQNKKQIGLSDDFEFPPTLDIKSNEYKAWYKTANYDNPVDLRIFESYLHQEKNELKGAYEKVVELRDTYKTVNDGIIDTDIEKVNEYFGKAGINLKDFGVDFNEELIGSMIFVEKDGKKALDENMFTFVNNEIPIMKTGALATKFMNMKGSEVLTKIRDSALEQGRREGANKVNEKKPVNKGLGNSNISGDNQVDRHKQDKDYYNLSEADLDREITYLMNKE